MKKLLKLLMFFSLLFLGACSADNFMCIGLPKINGKSYTMIRSETIMLDGKGQYGPNNTAGYWFNTGVTLTKSDPNHPDNKNLLSNIKISGAVSLCPSQYLTPEISEADSRRKGEYDKNGNFRGKLFELNLNKSQHFIIIPVQANDALEIVIAEKNEGYGYENTVKEVDEKGNIIKTFENGDGIIIRTIGSNMTNFSGKNRAGQTLLFRISENGRLNIVFEPRASGKNTLQGKYAIYVKKYNCMAVNGVINQRNTVEWFVGRGNPNVSMNNGHLFAVSTGDVAIRENGNLWLRVNNKVAGNHCQNMSNDQCYKTNSGKYRIEFGYVVKSGSDGKGIGLLWGASKELLINPLQKMTKSFFTSFSNNDGLIKYIRAGLVFYITVYAIMYVMGLVQFSQLDLVIRGVKIAIILAVIRPDNWPFFYNNFFKLFWEGTAFLTNIATGNLSSIIPFDTNPFAYFENVFISSFFTDLVFLRILALLFMGPIGFIIFIGVCVAMFYAIKAICKAIFVYLFALIVLAFLFMLTPLFLSLLLFDITKDITVAWVKLIFRYMIEPFFLILCLTILTEILVVSLHSLFYYGFCYRCIIPLNILSFWIKSPLLDTLFCINGFIPWGYDSSNPFGSINVIFGLFTNVIIAITVAYLMDNITKILPMLIGQITNARAFDAGQLSGGSNAATEAYDTAGSLLKIAPKAGMKSIGRMSGSLLESYKKKGKGNDDTAKKAQNRLSDIAKKLDKSKGLIKAGNKEFSYDLSNKGEATKIRDEASEYARKNKIANLEIFEKDENGKATLNKYNLTSLKDNITEIDYQSKETGNTTRSTLNNGGKNE
jgi:type IV secretory pathway VirB6-like protein